MSRKEQLLKVAAEQMHDACSPGMREASRATLAFDAGYLALLASISQDVASAVADHPCPRLAEAGARALDLREEDVNIAVTLARTRYSLERPFSTAVVMDWARRVLAKAE